MNIKILTLSLFTIFSITSLAQETKPKVKEVGITFYNFQNYGAMFKIGQENKLWRFRVLSGNINSRASGDLTSNAFGFNISAGRERRKAVSDKLNFIYGIELSSGYRTNVTKDLSRKITQKSISLGFTGVIGFNYFINKNLFVGGELLPIAQFVRTTNTSSLALEQQPRQFQYNFGFNNNSILLSVGIKF